MAPGDRLGTALLGPEDPLAESSWPLLSLRGGSRRAGHRFLARALVRLLVFVQTPAPLQRTLLRPLLGLESLLLAPVAVAADPQSPTKDAFDNVIEYTHQIGVRQEIVTDRNLKQRLLEYDARGNVVKEVDPQGKQVLRTFDESDNRLTETEPHAPTETDPPTTAFTYDERDNVNSVTDPEGNRSEHTYNERSRVLTTKDARGNTTENTYDAKGNLLNNKDPLGTETTYTHDPSGNVLTQTVMVDGVAHVMSYEYDAAGNLMKETDPEGHSTSYTYDASGNRLTQTTTRTLPDGSTETLLTQYEYDKNGRLTKTIDPDGSFTRTVYDALGRQAETYDKLERKTSFTYDEMGRLIKTTFPDGTPDPSDNPTEDSTYDAEGRRLTSKDRSGRVTTYEYDANGRLTFTRFPASEGETQPTTENRYDDAGRLVQTIDARLKSTFYAYDDAGRRTSVKDPLNNETLFGYDQNGNQTSVRDARLNTTTFEYDELNRRTRTTFPDTTYTETTYDALGRRTAERDQAGKVTRFEYDKLGRLTAVVDALLQRTEYEYDQVGNRILQRDANGQETRFEYDKLGRETRRCLPDDSCESREYDLAGNLIRRIDFEGRVTEYTYDENDRLLTRTYPSNPAQNVSFTYSPTGRLETMTDARGTTSHEYDLRDRPIRTTYPSGVRIDLAYDANGSRVSLTAVPVLGSPVSATFEYDDASRLDIVKDVLDRSYDLGYDENGNRASLVHANGASTTYDYDALNRLRALTTVSSAGAVQAYGLTLGLAGNRTNITEQGAKTRDFAYDDLYRLIQEKVTGPGGLLRQEDLTYDNVGNRLTRTFTDTGGTATTSYTYDTRDRLLTENAGSYTWDANGNLTSKDSEGAYTWDLEKRLVRVDKTDGTVVEHAYDAFGNRVQAKVTRPGQPTETTDFLVDTSGSLSHVVAELDEAGQLTAFYLRADDELIAILRPDGAGGYTTKSVHSDFIGSIRALSDDTGAITDTYEYDAWGRLLSHVGTDPQPYAFAGEQSDPVTLWQHHRARYYDPRTGRFVGMDPFEGLQHDPASLHKYLYAANDPLDKTDPSGRFSLSVQIAIGAVIGAIVNIAMVQPQGVRQTCPSGRHA